MKKIILIIMFLTSVLWVEAKERGHRGHKGHIAHTATKHKAVKHHKGHKVADEAIGEGD